MSQLWKDSDKCQTVKKENAMSFNEGLYIDLIMHTAISVGLSTEFGNFTVCKFIGCFSS
jgi:hypothetical protein